MTPYPQTAADHEYVNRVATQFQTTKELIASWVDIHCLSSASDKGKGRRPGIPGTASPIAEGRVSIKRRTSFAGTCPSST